MDEYNSIACWQGSWQRKPQYLIAARFKLLVVGSGGRHPAYQRRPHNGTIARLKPLNRNRHLGPRAIAEIRPDDVPSNAAKQVFMKKVVAYPKNDIILRPPAFPTERAQVLRRLKSAVDAAECRDGGKLELQQFAELLGMPASTNHDWYYGQLPAAIRRFICGIERLSAPARSAFLDQVCRECPRLSHPRLAGNLIVLESAKALMEQPSGLVCILGSVEEVRRFVMTAMGNSTIPLGVTRRIAGIDLHQPELLVPIPGLLYFRKGVSLTQAKAQVKLLWKEIECSSAEIIMLNGLWDLFPELRNRIVALSDERNVILADAFKSGLPERQGKIIKTVATEMALPPSQAIRLLMGEK